VTLYLVASDQAAPSTRQEVGFLRMVRKRRVVVPEGTLHAYSEHASTTFCGIELATLSCFPDLVWPGGLGLRNARCPRCGEATAAP
jgi:hypothetical protein